MFKFHQLFTILFSVLLFISCDSGNGDAEQEEKVKESLTAFYEVLKTGDYEMPDPCHLILTRLSFVNFNRFLKPSPKQDFPYDSQS